MLSLLRRSDPEGPLAAWMLAVPEADLHLSAITVGEIERGIGNAEGRDPGFARHLAAWLSALLTTFEDRVLPFGPAEARAWGRLSARLGNATPDLMIAATASTHGLTVVTRNIRHFAPTGVPTLDPLAAENGF